MAYSDYTFIIGEFIKQLEDILIDVKSYKNLDRKKLAATINRVQKYAENAHQLSDEAILKELSETYESWIKGTNKMFASFGSTIPTRAVKTVLINTVYTEYSLSVYKAIQSLVNEAENIIYKTQVNLEFDKKIYTAVRDFPNQKTATEAMNVRRLINDKTIAEQSKNIRDGYVYINGRKYNYKKYIRLVHNVQNQALNNEIQLQRVLETGADLVQISVTGTGDFCAFYEGRVFSLSGNSKKYPSVSELPNFPPPWHPYCLHTFAPYFEKESISEDDKKELITPKSFLKKRGETRSDLQKRLTGYEERYINTREIKRPQKNMAPYVAGTLNKNYYQLQGIDKGPKPTEN